jgi:hypothetical protein
MGRTSCTEPQCPYSRTTPLLPLWAERPVQNLRACTVELYLYFPYGPYSLYSRAIPLLPLWAVRPVQSLSACTVELYLYYPNGPYGLYRASVSVRGCTLPYLTIYNYVTQMFLPLSFSFTNCVFSSTHAFYMLRHFVLREKYKI